MVALRNRLPELARRVARLSSGAGTVVTGSWKRARSDLMLVRQVEHDRQLLFPETNDDVDSGESELDRVAKLARAPPIRPAAPAPVVPATPAAPEPSLKKRREQGDEQLPAPSPGAGIALTDDRSGAGGLTRAQKKTQSRIIGGLFLCSFNTLIKLRELLLLRKKLRQPAPALPELVAGLAAEPVVAADPADGMSAAQLAHVAILYAQQATRVHKTIFGP